MSHYKGTLTAEGDCVCDSSGNPLWDYHGKSKEENEANARRLAACWNALEGVPTEWLENYVANGAKNILQENASLKAEIERLKPAPAQIPWWQFIREYKKTDEFMCRKCEQKFFVHKDGLGLPEECPSCKLRKELGEE